MEGAPKQADRVNIVAIMIIGIIGAVVVYASFIALQAFYNAEASKLEMTRNAEGKSAALRDFQVRQQGELAEYRMLEKRNQIVSLPIERAMRLVVLEVRGGNAGNLVPAVGPHDTPTAPVPELQATDTSLPVKPAAPTEPTTPTEGTEGATPAEGATPGNPPAEGATPGNPPAEGATPGNPPAEGAAPGNPPAGAAAPAAKPGGAPAGTQ